MIQQRKAGYTKCSSSDAAKATEDTPSAAAWPQLQSCTLPPPPPPPPLPPPTAESRWLGRHPIPHLIIRGGEEETRTIYLGYVLTSQMRYGRGFRVIMRFEKRCGPLHHRFHPLRTSSTAPFTAHYLLSHLAHGTGLFWRMISFAASTHYYHHFQPGCTRPHTAALEQ